MSWSHNESHDAAIQSPRAQQQHTASHSNFRLSRLFSNRLWKFGPRVSKPFQFQSWGVLVEQPGLALSLDSNGAAVYCQDLSGVLLEWNWVVVLYSMAYARMFI